MFGTFIMDVYRPNEAEALAEAINDICCPDDPYGWSSCGVYSFWDPTTREILYIGHSVDLSERFRQHNNLQTHVWKTIPVSHTDPEQAGKFAEIQSYFKTHDKLGYTLFVQSPISQPVVGRNKNSLYCANTSKLYTSERIIGDRQVDTSKFVEGLMIHSFEALHGELPVWNKIGGKIEGQNSVTPDSSILSKCLSDSKTTKYSFMISRSTVRELSDNPSFERYENYLHAARSVVFDKEFLRRESLIDLGIDFSNIQYNFEQCLNFVKKGLSNEDSSELDAYISTKVFPLS